MIGAVSVLVWSTVYAEVTKLLWQNDFVTASPWMFPDGGPGDR